MFWASITCLLPTLPLYVKDLGGSDRQVGLVMACFAVGLIGCRSWLGLLADKQGRKRVLVVGLLSAALAPLGYLFFHSLGSVALIRAFHGISIAGFTTGYIALVTDIAPANIRGAAIGYMSLVNPIALMLGPAMGGYLLEWGGYNFLFLLSSGLGCAGLLLMSLVREPRSHREVAKQERDNRFWGLLMQPRLRTPSLVMLFVGISFGSLTAFMPLFVRDAQLGINPGLFYLASACVTFCMRLVVGRASDRLGRGVFVTFGLAFTMLGLVVLSSAQEPLRVLLAGMCQGAGFGILIPMMSALIADRSLPQERGRLFGLCIGGFDIGIAFAGLLLGQVADWYNYRVLFLTSAAMVGMSAVLFLTRSAGSIEQSLKFATGRGRDLHAVSESYGDRQVA